MTPIDTVETRGFLSIEIDGFREFYRTEHAKVFDDCETKSDAATARFFSAAIPEILGGEKLHLGLALGLWNRCLSACQAALLLAERGMIPEAQTIVRSAYEFLFFAAAAAKHPDVLDSLMHGDTYARSEQAKSMLKEGLRTSQLTQEQILVLSDFVAKGVGKRQLSVFEAADMVGLSYLYATVYKGLSLVGAHATAASTNSAFQNDEHGITPVFGPSDEGLPFCVGLIAKCLDVGSMHFDSLLQTT